MPVISATPDLDNLTLTITAEFAAPVDRVWQIYADPRQLEQIWGPPTYPATFVDFEFAPGGQARYFMTSPEGEKFGGWWKFTAIDPTSSLAFDDGFADADLNPVDGMPVSTNLFEFTAIDTGTRAVYTSTYASAADLDKVLEMGVVEGASLSINQIDAFLAA
ncbi:activator of HSP90 ATPase [Gordonia spumicola]|uniref:Activator of HSP90 ATPase n=1 Tax=Gordonia spumicola TaxID=589161 RepID=A0A7I9VA68_9ACTN|nr:SRPBCC domain-containing protein [Gordonia spumicola]GEE02001.1 activator of HSP90 ATPase [Gordonia spumicola]